MIEEVFDKDSEVYFSRQAIVKLFGWKPLKCQSIKCSETSVEAYIKDKRNAYKCPYCGKRSTHVHSYYQRIITDLSIRGKPLLLHVESKRMRCCNPNCSKKTFASQIEGLTERYSRRSKSCREYLEKTLVQVPSSIGAYQSDLTGLKISRSTALRIVERMAAEIDYNSITRICIDDFATRKGQHYRTLVADANTRLPVEIIGSRDTQDVKKALKKYKNVKLVSRDRASSYASAISSSIPRAKQVADRFHLVQNSGEHIHDAIKHNINDIKAEISGVVGSDPLSCNLQMFQPAIKEHIELFGRIKELRKKGLPLDDIAKEVGRGRRYVTGVCNSSEPHGRKISIPKLLLPHLDIISKSVKEGKSYKAIAEDILSQTGCKVSYKCVCLNMKKLFPLYKPKQGCNRNEQNKSCAKVEYKVGMQLLSSGRIHIYVCNPDYGVDKKTGECSKEKISAEELISKSTILGNLRDVHNSFREALKSKDVSMMDKWISDNIKANYNDVVCFVKSVQKDIKPIKNAVRYEINNGLIEGLNNKMKEIKRSMYGRAGDMLLWKKIYFSCLISQHGM